MAKSGPITLGIAGLGRAGIDMHLAELKGRERKFKVVAGCDTDVSRAKAAGRKYGWRMYTKVADMLADPAVEMIDIATRSCDHCKHAVAALKTGRDVFLEKPMCRTYDEAKKLRAAAKRAKGKLYIRHNRRFEPAFQHIREIMASGILGDVYEIKLRRLSYSRRDDWQTLKRFGGGQLLNWGPHIIDHGLRLLESPLAGVWSDLKLVAAVGDAEDHIHVILTGKNGRTADIEISGGAAIPEPEYIVLGSRGGLTSDEQSIQLRYLDPRRKLKPRRANPGQPGSGFGSGEDLKWIEKTIPVKPRKKVDMTMIWDDLYDAVRNRGKFPITLDESIEVMKVVDLARKGTKFAYRK